jgi:insertion element IS1 protein InsB
MTLSPVHCPHCANDHVVKRGKTSNEKQRYLCQNAACPQQTFVLAYRHRGRLPQVKQQIIEMALNGSGIRDTARGLGISKDTVLSELKKRVVS